MADLRDFAAWAQTSASKLRDAANRMSDGSGYAVSAVAKYDGSRRVIFVPEKDISAQAKLAKAALQRGFSPLPCVHGYVPKRDTLSNAREHAGRAAVLRIDLKNFFPSISQERVIEDLHGLGFDDDLATVLARMSCARGVVATGISTAPVLSNLVFRDSDQALTTFACDHGLTYTRYADDMTFSGDSIENSTLDDITAILNDFNWEINDKKTKFMRRGHAQYVTGLSVSSADGPTIPPKLKNRLRMQLYYLEKFGYANCHEKFPWTLGRRRAVGLAYYVRHVEPALGDEFLNQISRIDFGLPEKVGIDEWDRILDELGVPEGL